MGVWSWGLGWPFSRSRRLSVRVTQTLTRPTPTGSLIEQWFSKVHVRAAGHPGSLDGEGSCLAQVCSGAESGRFYKLGLFPQESRLLNIYRQPTAWGSLRPFQGICMGKVTFIIVLRCHSPCLPSFFHECTVFSRSYMMVIL